MLKDRHVGEVGIVIANGPSLRNVSSAQLDKHTTIGTNRIYRKYIPDYYVCVNPLVISQYWHEIEKVRAVRFIRSSMSRNLGLPLHILTDRVFSTEPLQMGVHEGWTVTYVALQLAYWMGFSTVLLVGLDHRYVFDGKPNEENLMLGDDPNHFDPEYFKGASWHNPDLEKSEKSYKMARQAFERAGRRVINLTPDTGTDVFEKGQMERWLPS